MTHFIPKFGPEHFTPGDVIIKQGDLPEKFYIISQGRVEVVEQQDDGIEKFITTLQAGDYFGEIGMMRQTRRVATVRALTNVNVMSMDRATFAGWLNSSPVIQEELEALVQKRTGPLRLPFLDTDELVAPRKKGKRQTGFFETQGLEHSAMYAPGELIMRQGDIADKFYIIVEGFVDIIHQDDAQKETVLQQLGPGDFFGEIGLLLGGARIVSVRAVDGVKVVTFSRKSFMRWMTKSPDSFAAIKETAVRRRKRTGFLSRLDDLP